MAKNPWLVWCQKELDRLVEPGDDMQKRMNRHIMRLCRVFDKEGHSGFTASYAIHIFKRLVEWKPLTPLTGQESEWNGDQNNRCSAVFRNSDGSYIYIDGKVFSDDGGETWFTSKESIVPITFPYIVPTEPERILLKKEDEE